MNRVESLSREEIEAKADRSEAVIQDIAVVIDYDGLYKHNGIGYLGNKLVRFQSDDGSLVAIDITLADALEWMAENTACEDSDHDDSTWEKGALARFYRDVKAALK